MPSNLTKGSRIATCRAVIFANWMDAMLAFWSGMDVLVDPYTGGPAGTLRIVVLQDCDFEIRHAASFAYGNDMITVLQAGGLTGTRQNTKMQGDAQVLKSLNDVFFLETTVFEVVHAIEHVFQGRKYKGLRHWYDGQVDDSRCRRRYLTDRTFELGGNLTVAIRSTSIDPRTAPETFLAETLTLAQELLTAYQSAYEVAENARDNVTADELCDLQEEVEETSFAWKPSPARSPTLASRRSSP